MNPERHIPIDQIRRFSALQNARDGDFSEITDDFEKQALSEIFMNNGIDEIRNLIDTLQEQLARSRKKDMGKTAIKRNL